MDPQVLWSICFIVFAGCVFFLADYSVTLGLRRFNAWLDRR